MPVDLADKKFQEMLLALMVTNKSFVPRFRAVLKQEWFEYYELRIVAKAILDYYDKYKKTPDFEVLGVWLVRYAPTDRLKPAQWKDIVKDIKALTNTGLEYIFDHFFDFIQFRSWKEAFYTGADLLKAYNFKAVSKVMVEAQQWEKKLDHHINFFSGIFDWLNTEEIREVITTGIDDLDNVLDGGTGRGELSVILAPPSRGKTTMLVNMGTAALTSGHRVFHFHAEQSSNIIRARYAACLLGTDIRDLKNKPKLHAYKLQKFKKEVNDLYILKIAGASVDYIRGFIYRQGYPDLIILDYADKLVSARKYTERRFEIEAIYDELIRLSDEFNCSVVTASQTNRKALNKEKVTIEDFAEAFSKAAIADTVIALCQNKVERESNIMRLYMAKVRNEEGHQELECKVIFNQMKIMSMDQYSKVCEVV